MPHEAYFVKEDNPSRLEQSPTPDKSKVEHHCDSGSDGTSKVEDEIVYIHGLRFWSITAVIAVLMFLVFLEIPIVITALVAITTELGGFGNVGWIVASYLLGYIGVIVIFAKFSDIVGRKLMLLISAAFFVIFSAACGASQTLVQVIVFRAFQGIGGGGCYSICTIMMMEIVPPEKYTQYVSGINVMSALALLLGPIIGGAIAANTTWRWIFLINVPIGTIAFVMAFVSIPWRFPYQDSTSSHHLKKASFGRVDIPGTVLIILATLGLTAGFEEADSKFPWKSAYVISLLSIAGVLWIVLVSWERYVTLSNKIREPVLPWRFFVNRQMLGLLLNQFLLGGPTLIGMFILPQRFQLVYGISGLDAGVRLIPFSFAIPVATIFAAGIAGKRKVPLIYIFIIGSCFQVLGFALLSTLPVSLTIPARVYGYEILAGWGCGMQFSLLSIAIPLVNESRDRAVGMAAGAQFRLMGSTIVLSISTSVFNTYMRPQLSTILGISGSGEMPDLGTTLASVSEQVAEQIKFALAHGYNRQTLVLCVAAALQIPTALLLWKRGKQLVV
ncbi:hypothetical protein E8E14_001185 [Neopestalotiopsis sp. 37M]|nr:hypothetical protein E8E14_001185 [Neopestalotiopsis sp. 37M]